MICRSPCIPAFSALLVLIGSYPLDADPVSNDLNTSTFWLSRARAVADRPGSAMTHANESSALAPLQARAGDMEGMRLSLNQVRAIESDAKPQVRAAFLLIEVESYARARDETAFRARLDELHKVRDADPKAFNNYSVVTRLCECGRLEDALAWASLPAPPGNRWWYLSTVAAAQAKAGKAEACGRTLDLAEPDAEVASKESPQDGDYEWSGLASTAASAGDASRVARFASHLKADTAASTYATLALAEWEAGNKAAYAAEIKEARKFASKTDPHELKWCFDSIARAQAATGDAAGVAVTEAAFPIGPDLSTQTIALQQFYYGMARAYAILGDDAKVADRLKKARDIASQANDAGKSLQGTLDDMQAMFAPPYPAIIAALARKGKIDAAAKFAADAPPSQRAGALVALALVYAQFGRAEEALNILKSRDSDELPWIVFSMGKVMATSGKPKQWLNYADGLKSPQDRLNAYLGAAQGLMDAADGRFHKR